MRYNVNDNQSSIKTHFIVLPLKKRGQVGNENTGNNCFDHLELRSIQLQPPGEY